MPGELALLLVTGVSVAAVHTVAGPDHYLPFVALARARNWSGRRTMFWILLCGCGHVWSSVLFALIGAAVGWGLPRIQWLEAVRGGLAGWAMLLFGLVYIIWSLLRGNYLHRHFMVADETLYVYEHRDGAVNEQPRRHPVTPWVLMLIFLLGPCEPMIPLLLLPAARASWWHLALLVACYTAVTLFVMALIVTLLQRGLQVAAPWLERHQHLMSGAAIASCGAAMVFLGW